MNRSIRTITAMVAMFVASRFPDSTLAAVVRYSAMAYMLVDITLRVRAGYLRRLPHWTPESWRRFLTAAAVPLGALLVFAGLMVAFEFRPSFMGPPRSTLRSIWIGVMAVLILGGGWGLGSATVWLTEGDPSQQFTRFQKRHRRLPTPDSAA